MGGCRCTYRSCTVKSDKQTHLFHYPVFDKVRCHQWLTNARRLDFLNLKVSQLKNRVVCQHHFKDKNFMNFIKDKLTFDAVPTEDGPFCDSKTYPNVEIKPEVAKVYPITIEDIENDLLCCKEKQANFSVKYADFLINCEIEPVNTTDKTMLVPAEPEENMEDLNVISNPDSMHNTLNRVSSPTETYKIPYPVVVVPPFSDHNNVLATNVDEKLYTKEISNNKKDWSIPMEIEKPPAPKKSSVKIKILSEENISETLPLPGKLEPVSPSLILHARNKKTLPGNRSLLIKGTIPADKDHQELQTLVTQSQNQRTEGQSKPIAHTESFNEPKSNMSLLKTENNVLSPYLEPVNQINKSNLKLTPSKKIINQSQTSPSVPLLKNNKIPAERVAAIEEKRNFNKKLRDMIEFCLDEIDVPGKCSVLDSKSRGVERAKRYSDNIYQEKIPANPTKNFNQNIGSEDNKLIINKGIETLNNKPVLRNTNRKQKEPQKMEALVLKETNLPNLNENTDNMAALESRLKKMEDALLCKIDQNSQKIVDLQTSLTSTSVTKKSTLIQTGTDESYKKYLFQEISKFLSPETNSLIYEELFLDRFSKNPLNELSEDYSVNCKTTKRRKYR